MYVSLHKIIDAKNENSLLNSGHQLWHWQDNIQKPGFWQFWDVQSSGSTMYIPDKYKNIQNNVSHGRLISTITEAKHIFLYKRRPHSNPHPSAPNWQIWCMVCTGLKGHNSNQKTLELKCTKECRSRVAQGLLSPLITTTVNRATHMVGAVVAHTVQEHPVQRNQFRVQLYIEIGQQKEI